MGKRGQSGNRQDGSLLASVFILTLGAGCCLFTVATLSPRSFAFAASIVGSVAAVFILLAVFQRFGRMPSSSLSFLLTSNKNKRDDGANDYLPRKVADPRSTAEGSNRPISAEEAHEMRVNSPNTWVPAPVKRKRRK
jgi:hypothetical protein